MERSLAEQLQDLLWDLRWACDDLSEVCAVCAAQVRRAEHLRWSPRHLSAAVAQRPRPVDQLLHTYQSMAQDHLSRYRRLHYEWAAWYAWTAGRVLLAASGAIRFRIGDVDAGSPDNPDRDRCWGSVWQRDIIPPLPSRESWNGGTVGGDPYLERARQTIYEKRGAPLQERLEALLRYGDEAADRFRDLCRLRTREWEPEPPAIRA